MAEAKEQRKQAAAEELRAAATAMVEKSYNKTAIKELRNTKSLQKAANPFNAPIGAPV